MDCTYTYADTPVGRLTVVASGDRLVAILWPDDKPERVRLGVMARDDRHPVLVLACRQLAEYFAGTRQRFDLPLEFSGTEFQKSVWNALLEIPFGETRSYAAIAARIGNVKAVRAVGAANGRNPLSIVAPCHRVIGATGGLTGFAGGLQVKQQLLSLERPAPTGQA
jgi:methylated-DNA-[protein]-cysteine S-methyltransferase